MSLSKCNLGSIVMMLSVLTLCWLNGYFDYCLSILCKDLGVLLFVELVERVFLVFLWISVFLGRLDGF